MLSDRLFVQADPHQNVDGCRYLGCQHKCPAQQTGINVQVRSQPNANAGDDPAISGSVQLPVLNHWIHDRRARSASNCPFSELLSKLSVQEEPPRCIRHLGGSGIGYVAGLSTGQVTRLCWSARYPLRTIGDAQLGRSVADMRSGRSEASAQRLGDFRLVQPLDEMNLSTVARNGATDLRPRWSTLRQGTRATPRYKTYCQLTAFLPARLCHCARLRSGILLELSSTWASGL
jgi:hypothetical protein